jgi:hypothetical protein
MKHSQVEEYIERLDEVARHVIEVPAYKTLSHETGIPCNYLTNVMARLIKIRRTGERVPKEALLRALTNEREFLALMEILMRKRRRPHVSVITQIVSIENEKGMM